MREMIILAAVLSVLLVVAGCATNYKTTVIHARANGDVHVHGQTENLTEGGVQANAKANAVENLGVNK